MRAFTVTPGVKGFVVQIGCQVAGFSNANDLLLSITEYLNDPDGMEERLYSAPMRGRCGLADQAVRMADPGVPDCAPPTAPYPR